MTSMNRGITGFRPDDEHAVDELLADAGFPDDAGLRLVLLQLRTLRDADVPPPSVEVLALMGKPATADVIPLDQARTPHRPGTERSKRRAVLTALAVAASLGVAGTAAAGNETIRRGAEGTISTIVRSLTPQGPPAPPIPDPATRAPATPPQTGADAPGPGAVVVPSPAGGPHSEPSPPALPHPELGPAPAGGDPGAADGPEAPAAFPESPGGGTDAARGPAEQGGKDAAGQPGGVAAEVDGPGAIRQEQPGEATPTRRPDTQTTDAPRPTATKQDPQR